MHAAFALNISFLSSAESLTIHSLTVARSKQSVLFGLWLLHMCILCAIISSILCMSSWVKKQRKHKRSKKVEKNRRENIEREKTDAKCSNEVQKFSPFAIFTSAMGSYAHTSVNITHARMANCRYVRHHVMP